MSSTYHKPQNASLQPVTILAAEAKRLLDSKTEGEGELRLGLCNCKKFIMRNQYSLPMFTWLKTKLKKKKKPKHKKNPNLQESRMMLP